MIYRRRPKFDKPLIAPKFGKTGGWVTWVLILLLVLCMGIPPWAHATNVDATTLASGQSATGASAVSCDVSESYSNGGFAIEMVTTGTISVNVQCRIANNTSRYINYHRCGYTNA